MFLIKSDGKTVGICDQPRFIKVKESTGCFVETTEEEAQGVSANGTPYNLAGHDEIQIDGETAPEAEVVSTELLDYIKGLEDSNAALQEANSTLEDTICELDSGTDERITNAEDSICELDILVDELMNGGNE